MIRHTLSALALLCGASVTALAQGPVVKLTLQGAGSQTGTGAFRCAPGEEGQMSLGGTDASLSVVPLEPYEPEAVSSDENVIVAKVASYSAYIVNVVCVSDGEAWITVKAGDAVVRMAALVGKARRKPNPKWTGDAASIVGTSAPAAPSATAVAPTSQAAPLERSGSATTTVTPPQAATPAASAPVTTPSTTPVAEASAPASVSTTATTVQATQTNGSMAAIGSRQDSPAGSTTGSTKLTAVQPLAAATGVEVAYIGEGRVAVKWNTVLGAAMYDVVWRNIGSSSWMALNTTPVTGTSFVTDPLAKQGTYVTAGGAEFVVVPRRSAQDNSAARNQPVAVSVPRWSGRYRVTVNGFRVNHETFDTPVETDGKRDEVFVRVGYREYSAEDAALGSERVAKTHVHGDINADRWTHVGSESYRYRAGSASQLGGLRTGDGFPNQAQPWTASASPSNESFPLFVWEGYLAEGGGTVAISPAVYEDDEVGAEIAAQDRAMVQLASLVALRVREYPDAPGFDFKAAGQAAGSAAKGLTGRSVTVLRRVLPARYALVSSVYSAAVAKVGQLGAKSAQLASGEVQRINNQLSQMKADANSFASDVSMAASLIANTRSRPIGISGIAGGKMLFDPVIVSLSFESAEDILANKDPNSDVPTGIVAIRYQDSVPGGDGDYTLYLQVTRVQ